jgi:redox-sensitive bicupin YhaK (pirin superfamily)
VRAFGYEVVRGIVDSTPYALPEAGAMPNVRRLTAGERTAVPDAVYVYVHVVRGEVKLDGAELSGGDAARITDAQGVDAVAGVPGAEMLLWEMRTA